MAAKKAEPVQQQTPVVQEKPVAEGYRRVRITRCTIADGAVVTPGQVIDISIEAARILAQLGKAERV